MRRVLGGVLVLALAVATALVSRRVVKPQAERETPSRVKGEASAPVTIVEYSDFECPACRVAEPPLRQLMDLYKGKIRLVFKHFPLEMMHHTARFAAGAAECAAKQGKFWELHDLLYEKQPEWAQAPDPQAAVLKLAGTLKLDAAALKTCAVSAEANAAIDADVKDGNDRFVYSTPTFFIDGKRFVGARQLSQMAPGWIDRRLKAK